jgi:serine/threonine-protein kinase
VASESPVKTIKTLGGFELIQKIGQGGMGTVLKARQISLDRVVALKVLPPKIAQKDPVFVERFIREARTSAKLNHPNIVQGIEVGKDEATQLYFFAMEFIDGPTVKALLKQQRVLEEKRALEIALGVTQALICAHRAGIVHRDIKPDNILLTSRGEPKLADLGLARHALDEESDDDSKTSADDPFGLQSSRKADLTQAGSAVGTPSYMAPEQIRAEMDKIDARTDLYALGTTLFHMLTGKPPYTGNNSKVVMAMHLTSSVPEARSTNPAISEATSKLVYKLMQKEQEKRVQSPEDLAREIERILHGKPAPTIKSGKHAPIGDGERGSHGTNESTAWRTHVSGPNAPVKTSTRHRPPVTSRMTLYVGLGVAAVACAGIAYSFAGGRKPVVPPIVTKKDPDKALPIPTLPDDPKKAPDQPPSTQASVSQNPATPATDTHPADGPKWPALDRAIAYYREHPTDFASSIEKFHEAEKGAPVAMIPTIRHELYQVEHARDAAFLALLDDRLKSARAAIAGGSTNYASALGFLQESQFSGVALTDGNKTTLANNRDDIEKQAVETYKKTVEPGLLKEFESAGWSLTALEALQQKLPPVSKMYGVKAVSDSLDAINKNVSKRIQDARDKVVASQEDSFRRAIGTAYALSLTGDFSEALNKLNSLQSDPAMAARFGGSLGILALDVQLHQNCLKSACDVLNSKCDKSDEVSLHDLDGVAIFGKVVQKIEKVGGRYLIQGEKPQTIDSLKIDAADALQLAGTAPQGSERQYKEAAYYFWRGKMAKAYDLFAKLKKDNAPEASAANIYIGWMEAKANELIVNTTELFNQARGGKLSPEEARQKQTDAARLVLRLKTDFPNTEAYRAKHPKK